MLANNKKTQKLDAEILEKGKVFQNLIVTVLLNMKIPKVFDFLILFSIYINFCTSEK